MAKRSALKLYKSYMFKEKDPVIDQLRTLMKTELGGLHLTDVRNDGGPSISAMSGWFYGETKRPQSATVEAAGRAIGYKRVWEKMRK